MITKLIPTLPKMGRYNPADFSKPVWDKLSGRAGAWKSEHKNGRVIAIAEPLESGWLCWLLNSDTGDTLQERFLPYGPALRNIEVLGGEETPCFTAVLSYCGAIWSVSNEGRGGANNYQPFMPEHIEKELDAWAAKNNPPFDSGMGDGSTLEMDFETWTFDQAYKTLEATCAS